MQPSISQLKNIFVQNLIEDLGICGDITSTSIFGSEVKTEFQVVSREDGVFCGLVASDYYLTEHTDAKYINHVKDSDKIKSGQKLITGSATALELLKIERVLLNYIQHLSGVATLTRKYVDIVNKNVKICDTRKTIPGIRALQKYAVKCGGGHNHRYSLDSGVLIKDNHIKIAGSITEAVNRARQNSPHLIKIEVECDNLSQVKEALEAKAEVIMLDNMSITAIQNAISLIDKRAIIEISGGINLDNIASVASLGADYISIGKITHSVNAIDIGLDI